MKNAKFKINWKKVISISLISSIIWSVLFVFIFNKSKQVSLLIFFAFLIGFTLIHLLNWILFLTRLTIELIALIQLVIFTIIWINDYQTNIYF